MEVVKKVVRNDLTHIHCQEDLNKVVIALQEMGKEWGPEDWKEAYIMSQSQLFLLAAVYANSELLEDMDENVIAEKELEIEELNEEVERMKEEMTEAMHNYTVTKTDLKRITDEATEEREVSMERLQRVTSLEGDLAELKTKYKELKKSKVPQGSDEDKPEKTKKLEKDLEAAKVRVRNEVTARSKLKKKYFENYIKAKFAELILEKNEECRARYEKASVKIQDH